MNNISKKELQDIWDKYPVNWWLKLYDKTLVRNPEMKTWLGLRPFTFCCVVTWIIGFITLFMYAL